VSFLATAAVAVLVARLQPVAIAEITAIEGSIEVEVLEYVGGHGGDIERVSEAFPLTSAVLPLRVLAQLAAVADRPAAAAVAAQFADPRELDQPNPEEFAITLALNSGASTLVSHQGRAECIETRSIEFSPGELPGTAAGDEVALIGRLFIDGVLAIFATEPDRDLTGAGVEVRILVAKQVDDQDDAILVDATMSLRGGSGAQDGASVETTGPIPVGRLLMADLSSAFPEFGALHVLSMPELSIEYPYTAVVGEPFKLKAVLTLSARNVEQRVGVAAILGAPLDSLRDVITSTVGSQAADKLQTALEQERRSPSGEPVLRNAGVGGPGACGLFGLEGLLAVVGLLGWQAGRPCRMNTSRR
jgi:hypothetical protein